MYNQRLLFERIIKVHLMVFFRSLGRMTQLGPSYLRVLTVSVNCPAYFIRSQENALIYIVLWQKSRRCVSRVLPPLLDTRAEPNFYSQEYVHSIVCVIGQTFVEMFVNVEEPLDIHLYDSSRHTNIVKWPQTPGWRLCRFCAWRSLSAEKCGTFFMIVASCNFSNFMM